MNVFQLPMLGMASSQVSASEPGLTGQDTEQDVDFAALLSGVSGRLESDNQGAQQLAALHNDGKPAGMSRVTQSNQSLLAALGLSQAPDTAQGSELFSKLGQNLLEIVSKLLNGEEAAIDKDKLTDLLSGIIESLSKENDGSTPGNLIIKLFSRTKELAESEKLEGNLAKLAEGLPETLKLRIKLMANRSTDHSSVGDLGAQGMSIVHFKLVANLIGSTGLSSESGLTQGGLQEGLTSQLPASIQAGIADRLMAKFSAALGAVEAGPARMSGGTLGSEISSDLDSNHSADVASAGIVDSSEPLAALESAGDIRAATRQRLRLVEGANSSAASAVNSGKAAQGAESAAATATLDAQSQPKGPLNLGAATTGEDTTEAGVSLKDATAEGFGTPGEGPEESVASSTQGDRSSANPAQATATQGKSSFAAHINEAQQASTAQQPAKHGPANAQNVLGQIVEKFDVLMGEGKTEARLELKPKYLGELKIHLVMENGSMKALLDASTHHAKEIIESNLASLKQQLENQGLLVKEFNVSVGQQRGGQAQGGFAGAGRFGRGHFGQNHAQPEHGQEVSNGRVSYNLGGNRAVNYLA